MQDIGIEHGSDIVGPIFYYADGAMLFQTYAPISEDAKDTSMYYNSDLESSLSFRESCFYNYLGRPVILGPGQTITGLSNDGRYVLLSKKEKIYEEFDVDILDTFLNQHCHLSEQEFDWEWRQYAFYGGDEWLIGFGGTDRPSGSLNITRYHLPSLFLGSNLGLSVRAQEMDPWPSFCIDDVENEAYVVSKRKWYRLDLNSLE